MSNNRINILSMALMYFSMMGTFILIFILSYFILSIIF